MKLGNGCRESPIVFNCISSLKSPSKLRTYVPGAELAKISLNASESPDSAGKKAFLNVSIFFCLAATSFEPGNGGMGFIIK